ncbi:3-ketoacyl-CoA synthase 11 [Vitis vinifera]|uniref:3-ketoacyl-CoA synthase 11 n=1 Tax=Vitis vinifera TaxID=29760 RepID=A0A438IDT5_VITVI|nr:3-ketoacyl-CoA synthase 11 [Vitis vinifera]
MRPFTLSPAFNSPALLRLSFFFTLLLHTLLSGTPFTYLFRLLSAAPTSVSLSCAWCVLLSLFYFYSTRPRPVLLLNYACFKPESHRRCTLEVSEYFLRRSHSFSAESEAFMRGIYLKSGLGDETYAPKFFFEESCEPNFEYAVDEAREGMFSAIDALLSKTRIDASRIDVVIITSGSFSPSPSLSSS